MDITGKEVFKRRVLELEKLGHRGSATVFEDRAADYLINELSASDIEANKEIFDGSNSLGARLLLHIVIAATGLAFISSFPIVTILVSVLTLISFIGEASTRFRILTRLLPKVQSRNVIGRIPSLNKNKPIYRLILCAHIDTQRIGLIWKDYIVKRASMLYSIVPGPMKSPFFILMLNFILQLFVGILSLILPTNALINIMLWIIAVSYAIHGFLFAEWTIGKYSPGACDNATGCAAAIAIAEYWLNNSVDNIELVILLTGCEETGLLGAAAWLDKHKTELKMSSNLFLNLDTLGYGAPRFLKKEFTMAAIPVSYPKEILSICDTAAQNIGLKKTGPYI
ncbi:MAG: Zn-dependent exopeptidase M28, partial [Deltaproteobacteria bacterium]|nr:Zn-dependent exopeptidase M28 [Deltaproteobacteria bacterium]